MAEQNYNVLFLCARNSATSIMAESLLNSPTIGHGRFKAYSAGSQPAGDVHPDALRVLQERKFPTVGLSSKSWNEFSKPGAPHLNFVFTLCADAVPEPAPYWPGEPLLAHWPIDNPAAVEDPDARYKAFRAALNWLRNRLHIVASLPLERLERPSLQKRLDELGRPNSSRIPKLMVIE